MPEPTILDTILAHKREEVAERQARLPQAELRQRIADLPPARGFTGALQQPKIGSVSLIAEVKKASPSAGIIRADFDPVQIARIYERNSASCLSVLTDEEFFQGHDNYLTAIKSAVNLPILRKDFTVHAYQIFEARALGADAILLIVAALTPAQLRDYQALAQSLGMAALVEVHSEAEMQGALDIRANLIGINSRNLNTFETDLGTVERLTAMVSNPMYPNPMYRSEVTLVAESGIKTPADVQRVANAGAKAVLVGETLMRAPDIGAALRELLSPPGA